MPFYTSSNGQAGQLEERNWSRWHIFAFMMFGVASAGTSYAFGIFSTIFKAQLNFSTVQLSIIGTLGSIGSYCDVLPGALIKKHGPKTIVMSSSFIIALGFIYIYLAVLKVVPHHVAILAVVYFITQAGVSGITITSATTTANNFPAEVRGQCSGLAKAYFGLSSAILAILTQGFFNDTSVDFILFVAIMIPIVELCVAQNIQFLPHNLIEFPSETVEPSYNSIMPYNIHFWCLFISILIIGILQFEFSNRASNIAMAIVACSISLAILLVPTVYGQRQTEIDKTQASDRELELGQIDNTSTSDNNDECGISTLAEIVNNGSVAVIEISEPEGCETVSFPATVRCSSKHLAKKPDRTDSFFKRSIPLKEALMMWRCHVIILIYVILGGTTTQIWNNIQAIAAATGMQASPFFVLLLSLSNGFGRAIIGPISDATLKYISRLQWLSGICIVMAISVFALSFGKKFLLYPSLILVGIMFGFTSSALSAISADIFGTKYFGTTYGFINFSPAIGAFLFSSGLVAALYPNNNGDEECVGAHCFKFIFIIDAICCLVAFLLAIVMDRLTPFASTKS